MTTELLETLGSVLLLMVVMFWNIDVRSLFKKEA